MFVPGSVYTDVSPSESIWAAVWGVDENLILSAWWAVQFDGGMQNMLLMKHCTHLLYFLPVARPPTRPTHWSLPQLFLFR